MTKKTIEEPKEKILLVLMPFWTPLIPPIGMACLKSDLQRYGYQVTAVDASVVMTFRDLYDEYFEILKKHIPEEKRGNFFSVGHDVLRNHLVAGLNDQPEERYLELVKVLAAKTFYVEITPGVARELQQVVMEFYRRLEKYMIELLENHKPGILGLSVFSDTLPASLFAFRLTRQKYPHIKTIMGGGVFADHLAPGSPNLELFLEQTRDYIDAVIIGEGEILFRQWLNHELPPGQRVFTLHDLGGKILDLSTTLEPDMTGFDLRNYPFVVSYASRSCPYQCSFCSETVQWGKYRKKEAGQVYDELKKLYHRHGTQLFLLSDSLLNPVIDQLAGEFSRSDLALYWGGWLRADGKTGCLENVQAWRKGGFYHARLGLESGSQEVLDLMGKKITIQQIKTAVSTLASVGIKTTTLWVVGHPGETEADFQQTLDLISELRPDIYEAECRPFYYYVTGQVGSGSDWWSRMQRIPLYPAGMQDMLWFETWLLDCEPQREDIYRRMNRFVDHCKKLGVPNPYSLQEIYEADRRWQQLHKNSVPPLVEFKNSHRYIDECKQIKPLHWATPSSSTDKDHEAEEYLGFDF